MDKKDAKRSRAESADTRSAYEAVKSKPMAPPPRPSPRTPPKRLTSDPPKRLSSGSTNSALAKTKTKKSIVQTKSATDADSRASPTPTIHSRNSPRPEQSKPDHCDSSQRISNEPSNTDQVSKTVSETKIDTNESIQDVEEPQWTPRDPLENFDYEHLLRRQEAQMQQHMDEEQQLWERAGRLNQLLETWATVGAVKEAERSNKRLRTRVAYVHHQEQKLQRSQAHYTNVRKALQAALERLDIEEPSQQP